MRVALILPGGVGRDGVHLVIPALLDLIEELGARHEVLVAALEQEETPACYNLRGARVLCLGRAPLGVRLARLLGALRPFQPQVVHSFWFGTTSTLGALAGFALGAPLVASLGGGELTGLPAIGYGGLLVPRTRLHTALALWRARAVTAGSAYALAPLQRRRRDARWLPLGVAPAEPRPAEGAAGPPWRLLHVATINRVKGPLVLLDAFAAARAELRARTGHPEPLLLDWVGLDILDGQARHRAVELGLADAVRFHGWLPHAEVLALMAEAQLYLQASFHESQGVAVCEAAAAGVPTVGTAVGLVAELAPVAAVAVPVGDGAALGRAIVATLLAPEALMSLGRAAQAWARAHSARWSAAQFERIYAEVARASAPTTHSAEPDACSAGDAHPAARRIAGYRRGKAWIIK